MSIARARALIVVAAMLLVAVAFAGWAIASTNKSPKQAQCQSAGAPGELPKPEQVTVRVLNATERDGLAGTVRKQLAARGFRVPTPANAEPGESITGIGQLRFGAAGAAAATLLQTHIIGITPVQDERDGATVEVVLGEAYSRLATTAETAAAVKRLQANPVRPSCAGDVAAGN